MLDVNAMKTSETDKIEAHLGQRFNDVEAYRYNSASIRVRVVGEEFSGKSMAEREAMVLPLISQLPEDTCADITVLLLLTPEEKTDSLMNIEFDRPSPSTL